MRLQFVGEYARFENINNFVEEELPTHNSSPSGMSANTDFDQQSTYTIPSKMNSFDQDDTDFDVNSNDGNAPF